MSLPPIFRRQYSAPGAAPGTTADRGEQVRPTVHVIRYSGEDLEEWTADEQSVLDVEVVEGRVTWIDVRGLGDGTLVQALGERFGLHRLAVSDVLNTGQRPKADDYGGSMFFVVRMVEVAAGEDLRWEQVSLFLLPGLVLSFQEHAEDCLDPLRDRLRSNRRNLRSAGSDYLACMIIDAIVDGYFPVIEEYGERLEELEVEVLASPTRDVLARIYRAKRELLAFRRAAWPLRETLSRLLRDDSDLIGSGVEPYLRDTTDHVMQVADVVETYRELAGSLVDVYLSMLGHRTNETMRVLTVIATIFIPLTFVAGIYGMNFDTSQPGNLPELGLPYGYVLFWALCLAIAVSLAFVFRRLGWFGSRG